MTRTRFPSFSQIINDYSFDFLFIGESKLGEYDPFNLDDVPLMRIYISKKDGESWVEYKTCQTMIAANTGFEQLKKAYDFLVGQISPHLDNSEQMDKLMQFFSWLRWKDDAPFVAVGDNS